MEKKGLKLRAELDHDILAVFLEKKGLIVGEIKTANDRNLSVKLLPLLDKFLEKNGVAIEEINDTKLESKLPDSFTSYRIVKVILDAVKWNSVRSRFGGSNIKVSGTHGALRMGQAQNKKKKRD